MFPRESERGIDAFFAPAERPKPSNLKKRISPDARRPPLLPSQRATRKDGKSAKEAKQSKRFRKAQASVPGRMAPQEPAAGVKLMMDNATAKFVESAEATSASTSTPSTTTSSSAPPSPSPRVPVRLFASPFSARVTPSPPPRRLAPISLAPTTSLRTLRAA